MTLIDFTLSNARRFYSSMGNSLAVKGLTTSKTMSPLTHVLRDHFAFKRSEKEESYTPRSRSLNSTAKYIYEKCGRDESPAKSYFVRLYLFIHVEDSVSLVWDWHSKFFGAWRKFHTWRASETGVLKYKTILLHLWHNVKNICGIKLTSDTIWNQRFFPVVKRHVTHFCWEAIFRELLKRQWTRTRKETFANSQ